MTAAVFVTWLFTVGISPIANIPSLSWRIVFIAGLVPIPFTVALRLRLHEPEGWLRSPGIKSTGTFFQILKKEMLSLKVLFTPKMRRYTVCGWLMVVMQQIPWWSLN